MNLRNIVLNKKSKLQINSYGMILCTYYSNQANLNKYCLEMLLHTVKLLSKIGNDYCKSNGGKANVIWEAPQGF